MTILVTGAAGFIGSNLCTKLLKEEHDVLGVDNFVTGDRRNIQDIQNRNWKFLRANVEDLKLRQRVDTIYHLACPTGVPNIGILAEKMFSATSAGTKNILEIAKRNKVKVLLASSSEIYGDPEVEPQKESYTGNVDPTGFRSPYEEGKRFSEALATMYHRKYGMDVRIVRIFNTYGPRMSRGDLRVIPLFIERARTKKPLPIHGKGTQNRTFCYIDDLLDGFDVMMKKGKSGEVYNLGSNKQIRIIDLAKMIIQLTGSTSTIRFVARPSHDHEARLPELKKIRALGWEPTISLEEGLKRTIANI